MFSINDDNQNQIEKWECEKCVKQNVKSFFASSITIFLVENFIESWPLGPNWFVGRSVTERGSAQQSGLSNFEWGVRKILYFSTESQRALTTAAFVSSTIYQPLSHFTCHIFFLFTWTTNSFSLTFPFSTSQTLSFLSCFANHKHVSSFLCTFLCFFKRRYL